MITLLQHTHKSLPHYNDEEWDWLRGALCTVDRSYGRFLNVMHHHIADTHVAHHLFSQVFRTSHAQVVMYIQCCIDTAMQVFTGCRITDQCFQNKDVPSPVMHDASVCAGCC